MSFYYTPCAPSDFIQTIGYVTTAITVTPGYNAVAYSPLIIAPGGSVTIPPNSSLTIKIPC